MHRTDLGRADRWRRCGGGCSEVRDGKHREIRGEIESGDGRFASVDLEVVLAAERGADAEVVQGADFAFARTVSRGKVTVLADDVTAPEENRELFVLQKLDGEWKIARYMFNKMSSE